MGTHEIVVTSLSPGLQVAACLNALERAAKGTQPSLWQPRRFGNGISNYVQLQEEVRQGRCTIVLNDNGEAERLVSVLAIRIRDEESGNVLVELGRLVDQVIRPICKLPGTKLERGETAEQAVEKLLHTSLAPLAKMVMLETMDFDHTPQTWCSPRYNIRTRYLRTVYNACLYGRHKLHPRQESCSFFTWVTAAQLKEWAADAYQERMCVWLQAMDQTEAVDCFGDVGDDEVCTSVSATRRVHPSGRFSDLSQGPETFDRAHALQGRNS